MEKFEGRPVWHCSVSKGGNLRGLAEWGRAGVIADDVLSGVGEGRVMDDPGQRVLHVRRYTTAAEAERVGGAVDVRGTEDHRTRVAAVLRYLPSGWLQTIGEAP